MYCTDLILLYLFFWQFYYRDIFFYNTRQLGHAMMPSIVETGNVRLLTGATL